MAQQTAVEWFKEQIQDINFCTIDTSNFMTFKIQLSIFNKLLEQAKQIEKEQILDAIINNQNGLLRRKTIIEAEQYYNETYNP